jgi:hypothetical protein
MKVYVTGYWQSDHELLNTIKKFGFGQAKWKNIEFTIEKDFDKVIVLNGIHSASHDFKGKQAYWFRLEPPTSQNYLPDANQLVPGFLHWPFWYNFSSREVKKMADGTRLRKRRLFSAVTSDLGYMEGHIDRLLLIHVLDQKLSEHFDVYGRNTGNGFFDLLSNYCGQLDNKYLGLYEYAYHLAIENTFMGDYFTEKISDPILSECLTFYDGCGNLEEYIDSRAFIRISAKDAENG